MSNKKKTYEPLSKAHLEIEMRYHEKNCIVCNETDSACITARLYATIKEVKRRAAKIAASQPCISKFCAHLKDDKHVSWCPKGIADAIREQ